MYVMSHLLFNGFEIVICNNSHQGRNAIIENQRFINPFYHE